MRGLLLLAILAFISIVTAGIFLLDDDDPNESARAASEAWLDPDPQDAPSLGRTTSPVAPGSSQDLPQEFDAEALLRKLGHPTKDGAPVEPLPVLPEEDGLDQRAEHIARTLSKNPESLANISEQLRVMSSLAKAASESPSFAYYNAIASPTIDPAGEFTNEHHATVFFHRFVRSGFGELRESQIEKAMELTRELCDDLVTTHRHLQKELGIGKLPSLEDIEKRLSHDRKQLELWRELDSQLQKRYENYSRDIFACLGKPLDGRPILSVDRFVTAPPR